MANTAETKPPSRILIVTSLCPPDALGGAEISSWNLARGLRVRGFEVAILTTAKQKNEELIDVEVEGIRMWRIYMPRPYPIYYATKAKLFQKLLWHFLDHFDPRNRTIMANVLDNFKPDIVSFHLVQGVGYNIIKEVTKRNLRVHYYLHDVHLACIRMTLFRNGKECKKQCVPCKLSSMYKWSMIEKCTDLGFVSPSHSHLNTINKFLPIKKYRHRAIRNPNGYPPATIARENAPYPRFIYVGRLHSTKGGDVLLTALSRLASAYKFHIKVIGTGTDAEMLREKYKNASWCEFLGHLTHIEISNHMVNSDMLFVPSVCSDNSPGVIIHGVGQGLPSMASDIGGIPELVENHVTGVLVPPGDIDAWTSEIKKLLDHPELLQNYKDNCPAHADQFRVERIMDQHVNFILRK